MQSEPVRIPPTNRVVEGDVVADDTVIAYDYPSTIADGSDPLDLATVTLINPNTLIKVPDGPVTDDYVF